MKYTIKIIQDTEAGNPREEYDNLGHFFFCHGRYKMGDTNMGRCDNPVKQMLTDYYDKYPNAKSFNKEVVSLPVYMYDHSGLSLKTTPFRCPWDSGQVGTIWIHRSKILEEYGWKVLTAKRREQIESYLKAEIETMDQWLHGDVWGYVITDEDGEDIESCWGFYGYDYCQQEAEGVVDHLKKEHFRKYGEQLKFDISV